MRTTITTLVLACCLAVTLAGASGPPPATGGGHPTPEQVARLGADLTPVGAERAGNADGSIPAWEGGLPKGDPIDPKRGYVDPFPDEAPLYTITAANAAQYKDILSLGHQALLKLNALTFRMRVYPSHRTASHPDDVLAEVKKQAPLASTDGYHISDVGRSSVPFPVPADGLQVMWNHVFRWRGGSCERQFVWAPVTATGQFYIVRVHQTVVFDQQGYMLDSRPNRLFNSHQYFLSPPSAVNLRTLAWEPIDPLSEARSRWMYVPQTGDTRRFPSYDYDQDELMTNGLRLADQNDGWNGAPDRYVWKLLGKREVLIGYNAYKIAARGIPYPSIIRPRHPDPDLLRYERHRVWVVEATARKYHAYYRRVFYVDEDTWQVALEEIYDKAGNLVRFSDHQMIQYYDVQVPWYAAMLHYDLRSGAYLISNLGNIEPFETRWGFKSRILDFLPSNIRLLGLQ